ncbi:hypothetical protein LUZ61_016453 [Rhynchospora tenuis]|uniref:Uncharacterized protein n=1 Tax=Rhynchospora tenuis TaxID=198213 RepID=A0AAD6EK41_9POAL|nr:hypothetical protein LUZ61_016453 [Rhynchospora tenuis]
MLSQSIVLFLALNSFIFSGAFVEAVRRIDSCSTDGNYTDGSIFQTNLQKLLISLQTNAINSGGFSNITIGEPSSSGRVSGVLMCYGDKTPNECELCINTTTTNMTQACPYSRRASVIDDRCYLRYSDENFLGTLTTDQDYYDYSAANVSNPISFNKTLYNLMNKLTIAAAKTPLLYATDYSDVSDSNETVYGLVQCRQDLSAEDCSQAIADALQYTQMFHSIRQYVIVYLTTCYLRYSVYPFDVTIPEVMRGHAPPSVMPPPASGSHSKLVIIVVVSICLLLILISGFTIWLWRKKRTIDNSANYNYSIENENLSQELVPRKELQVFDLRTLRDATNNFSMANMLGEGGFGPVYKGILRNGEVIAVKKLKDGSKQGVEEFEAELRSLAALKHRNLVQLFGYYKDQKDQFVCYEFVPNGSLDNLLFGPNIASNRALSWVKRYKIIQGICCGLRYVHEESIHKIVHRDLKSANILIDKDMNPKISDFGTAKFFKDDRTHKFTIHPIWTVGYVAPEYHNYGKYSFKSDVYSFGVILLELVTGQKSSPLNPNTTSLIGNVIQNWVDGTIEDLKDPKMGEAPFEEIKRCIQIGLCCLHDNAARRPTMGEIDLMLQGYLEVPPISEEWLINWMEFFSASSETDSYQTQRYIVQVGSSTVSSEKQDT